MTFIYFFSRALWRCSHRYRQCNTFAVGLKISDSIPSCNSIPYYYADSFTYPNYQWKLYLGDRQESICSVFFRLIYFVHILDHIFLMQ